MLPTIGTLYVYISGEIVYINLYVGLSLISQLILL